MSLQVQSHQHPESDKKNSTEPQAAMDVLTEANFPQQIESVGVNHSAKRDGT